MLKRILHERAGLELSEYAVAAALAVFNALLALKLQGGATHNAPVRISFIVNSLTLLVPLAVLISYYDVRYRRIPNTFVLTTLAGGVIFNILESGTAGLKSSLFGCALAFGLMFLLHVFGAMGAGDVKLFAAVGSVIGLHLVVPAYLVVLLTGGLLALVSILRAGTFTTTMRHVLQIFAGVLPGRSIPRFGIPSERRLTIPYGVAIVFGSIISLIVFRV